jgi:hypothetical protein
VQQPFDDTTKAYYQQYFEKLEIPAITQYEVFARSRAIDLMVTCTAADLGKLAETVFAHFRTVNALEFKGYHDPLTAVDFNVIMMRAWGVGAVKQEESAEGEEIPNAGIGLRPQTIAEMPDQRTVTIVCVTRPTKVLDDLQAQFRFQPTADPGIYCNHEHQLPVWIIHPTELALKPANYPLLPLARGVKLAQFIELCIQQGLIDYLRLTVDIGLLSDPDIVWRKIMEAVNMKLQIREDTWPYIDEFFRSIPEAMGKVTTFREALEKSEQRGEERGEQRGIQQSILRVLQHKFGALPANLVQTIEATQDVKKLAQWLDQALDSNSLGDLAFSPAIDR